MNIVLPIFTTIAVVATFITLGLGLMCKVSLMEKTFFIALAFYFIAATLNLFH
jgi:hypothetical protein